MLRRLSLLSILSLLTTSSAYAQETWTDGARTTLAEDLDTTETGFDLTSGAAFPATPTSPGYFKVTIQRAATPTVFEIAQCTARSTNTITCARDCVTGTCDGTGSTFVTGDNVWLSVTAFSLARTNGAGANREFTFNNAAVPDGSELFYVDNSNPTLRITTTPTIAANGVKLYAAIEPASSMCPNMPARLFILRPSDRTPMTLMPSPLTKLVGWWGGGGANSSTNLNTWGQIGGFTASNCTLSLRAITDSTKLTRYPRYRCETAASSATSGDVYGTQVNFLRGNTADTGGFFVANMRMSWGTVAVTSRGFYGVAALNQGDIALTAAVNVAGFAFELTQTNLHWYTNDATGTVTDTDLGANFPVATTSGYNQYIYAAPASSTIEYCIVRLDAASSAYGSSSSNLPVNTTPLRVVLHTNTGVTASAVSFESAGTYIEAQVSQ